MPIEMVEDRSIYFKGDATNRNKVAACMVEIDKQ